MNTLTQIAPYIRRLTIPGHTADSAALLDRRTRALIVGDCLQLYGIYGSGNRGANISYPAEHAAAIGKLRGNIRMRCIFCDFANKNRNISVLY